MCYERVDCRPYALLEILEHNGLTAVWFGEGAVLRASLQALAQEAIVPGICCVVESRPALTDLVSIVSVDPGN